MDIRKNLANTRLHENLAPEVLKQQALDRNIGKLSSTGALVVTTGRFTGRSPKDKFFVLEEISKNQIDWNEFNIPIEEKYFTQLRLDLLAYLNKRDEVWLREVYAGADPKYRVAVLSVNEFPDSNLFVHNMFIEKDEHFITEWTIIQAPGFRANPEIHGTRQENFAVISIAQKTILIGGTGYTGEIKKGVFSVFNYLLPVNHQVLTMHCSANKGVKDDVAIFFGLSGTGKTTLSTDSNRQLIGDDEHAWNNNSVFNIEGGCYAKVIDLSEEKEPQIYGAIKDNALLENVTFITGTDQIDYSSKQITENTRVSYPIEYIKDAVNPSVGGIPKNIFFLTCDAFGILPPISKLTVEQAMFYFLSGYTAKVAGTEDGILEPKPTFSTCFGAPFLPLSPNTYAMMLGKKISDHHVNVWMVNTGWIGGGYGVGNRIKLSFTRAMIDAALNGELNTIQTMTIPIFNLEIPLSCPRVPSKILNPVCTWEDAQKYKEESKKLANRFNENFEKFKNFVSKDIVAAAPKD